MVVAVAAGVVAGVVAAVAAVVAAGAGAAVPAACPGASAVPGANHRFETNMRSRGGLPFRLLFSCLPLTAALCVVHHAFKLPRSWKHRSHGSLQATDLLFVT